MNIGMRLFVFQIIIKLLKRGGGGGGGGEREIEREGSVRNIWMTPKASFYNLFVFRTYRIKKFYMILILDTLSCQYLKNI